MQANLDHENLLMKIGHSVPYGDKIGHFLLFGLLGLLLNIALRFHVLTTKPIKIHWSTAIVLVFAVIEEFTQLSNPHRTFDLVDIIFDGLGVWVMSSDKMVAMVRSKKRHIEWKTKQ